MSSWRFDWWSYLVGAAAAGVWTLGVFLFIQAVRRFGGRK